MYTARDISVPPMISLEELEKEEQEWYLEEVAGPHGCVALKCDRPIIFGRNIRNCNMVFPEDARGISRIHCEVVPQKDGLLLKDLNSSYGTFLADGTRVREGSPVLLQKGDMFYLASREVLFKVK
ncbi:MAG: FHA domain-containing protein [Lachnospiraceae bacterium]|nr:FHA domain-containing protein [Lachnospiraceae bacterium]